MRELILFITLVRAIVKVIGIDETNIEVHEDNNGALTLANLEPGCVTPPSKWYAIKLHWFRGKVKEYKMKIIKIETEKQKAVIFTKGLQRIKFILNRKLLCGW